MVVTLGWANSVISSGRSPPLYCSTHTLIAMQGHQNNFLTNKNIALHTTIKIVDDSHIQRFVLATEETTVTQVSHRPNKCQSRSLSQIGTKNNTGHMVGDSPLLKPTGIKIATKPMQVQPTENIENLSALRRCLWVRTTVSTAWSAANISESGYYTLSYRERRLSDMLPNQQSRQN